MDKFSKVRAGTFFDPGSGKLYIFRPDYISVRVAWPRPMAWQKSDRNPSWSLFRPKINIPAGDLQEKINRLSTHQDENGQIVFNYYFRRNEKFRRKKELAKLQWYNTIPIEVRNIIARYRDRHWHLLALIARCGPAAFDLATTNPALAFALASNWVFHKPPVQRPLRSARALLKKGKKQRDIAGWLGFPETESARKILKKVPHSSITISSLLYLRDGMKDQNVLKTLQHLKRINLGVIRIITDLELRPYASFNLLDEVSQSKGENSYPGTAYLLKDVMDMIEIVYQNRRRMPVIKSITQLGIMHDSLVDEIAMNVPIDNEHYQEFPPPPIEGNEFIRPITTMEELLEESKVQHNCVASYGRRIAVEQNTYIYKVLEPERCTLSIIRKGDIWVLSELRKAHNKMPAEGTVRVVERWLAENYSKFKEAS